jgi:hypothetical protein
MTFLKLTNCLFCICTESAVCSFRIITKRSKFQLSSRTASPRLPFFKNPPIEPAGVLCCPFTVKPLAIAMELKVFPDVVITTGVLILTLLNNHSTSKLTQNKLTIFLSNSISPYKVLSINSISSLLYIHLCNGESLSFVSIFIQILQYITFIG